MGWSSLLEDITDRINSALGQIDLRGESEDNKPKTSARLAELSGLKATCERLLVDIKKHLSLATRKDMDLAHAAITLEKENRELIKAKLELSQALEETQKTLKRKTKKETIAKRRLWLEEKPNLGTTQLKKIKRIQEGINKTFIKHIDPEKRHSNQARTESTTSGSDRHSPQVRILLLRPKVAGTQESQIPHKQSVSVVDDAKSNIRQIDKTDRGKRNMRIHALAKELKLDNKIILEEARRAGVNARVPSNTVPQDVAMRIRAKYGASTQNHSKKRRRIRG